MKKPKKIHNFYKSSEWKVARQIKVTQAEGMCERCGAIGQEVHHIKRLKYDNVKDASISLDQQNLELLCKDCNNKEHKRFNKKLVFDDEENIISY
jgi:5-methylcytosine-specific restriction endonuclease McrA